MTLTSLGLIAAAALTPAVWKCDRGVTVSPCDGGVVVAAGMEAEPVAWASLPLAMPDFGPDVMQEIDIENAGALASGGGLFVEQLDAAGNRLPETLADMRWTTHIRPPGKEIAYRERGRLHPDAKSLRLKVELRRETGDYDAAGMRIADDAVRLPKFRITRVALTPAPKETANPAFFCEGASGMAGDRSLALGGAYDEALFFQTRSRGSWSGGYQFRNEKDVFYPVGPGTVEATFRPAVGPLPEKMTLFDAYNGFQIGAYHTKRQGKGIGSVMKLVYVPSAHELELLMRDYENRTFAATFGGVEMPAGKWTHVAVIWTPGAAAQVFVGGKKAGTLPLPGYAAVDLGDMSNRNVNDAHAMELYLGAAWSDTRGRKPGKPIATMFQGAADDFRISRGERYAADFAPSGRFACDDDTAALFTFDDGFDGVSAHGYGYVRASVYANRSRSLERVPPLRDEDNPRKVFNLENYRTMPSDAEFDEARRRVVKSFAMNPGETVAFDVPKRFYADYVEISNAAGTRPLRYARLVANGKVDPASFDDIRLSMASESLSDREKVDRVFQYVLGASDYFINNSVAFAPGTDRPHTVIFDALAMLNGYCGFECGPLNNMAASLFVTAAGCPASTEFGYGHMFEEVFFDGRNHVYDLSAQKFFPAFDNATSAGLQEMGDEPGLFARMNACPDHFIRKGTREPFTKDVVYQEKFAFTLNPGETVRWWSANDGMVNNVQTMARGKRGNRVKNSVGPDERDYAKLMGADDARWMVFRRDRLFPHYANAFLTFDGVPKPGNPAFRDSTPTSFAYRVASPYPIVWGEYAATRKDGTTAKIALSTDGGKTYRAIPGTTSEYMVKARYRYLVRVEAPMAEVARFKAVTEVMFNPRIFPSWPDAGRNALTLKGEGGPAEVKVAWREPAKAIRIAPDLPRVAAGTMPGFERQLVLLDPAKPLTLAVQGVSENARVKTFGPLSATLAGGRLTLSVGSRELVVGSGERVEGEGLRVKGEGQGERSRLRKECSFLSIDESTNRPLQSLFPRGSDNPEAAEEFPCVAAVNIIDGDAVKPLTVVISPNARLLALPEPHVFRKADDVVRLPVHGLPEGEYAVFSLSRFPGAEPQFGVCLTLSVGSRQLVDGSGGKVRGEKRKDKLPSLVTHNSSLVTKNSNPKPTTNCQVPVPIAKYHNSAFDYYKAGYARKGERARWKWDTAADAEQVRTGPAGAYSIRTFGAPEGAYEIRASGDHAEGIEFAALLVLPAPGIEARLDLKRLLFGINCAPELMRE